MAMSFKKRDAVAPTDSEEEEEEEEEKPDAAGDVFRRPSNGDANDDNSSGRKTPLHSGLSALIQAAATQLGQLDDHNSSSTRYTPHGFHTTSTTAPYNAMASSSESPSLLQTTPKLGPETANSEVRKQTFPEVLMTVLEDKTNLDVITFLPDGKFFAVRRKEFSETAMLNYFSVASFDEFLEKVHSWGFSRIDRGDPSSGVEIFRHAMFVKGDWEKCSHISFGESPTDVRLSALPDRARIEHTLSDELTLAVSKRRLSPSHTSHTRRESESSISKQRLSSSDIELPAISKSESADTASTDASVATNNGLSRCHDGLEVTAATSSLSASKTEDEVRSLALAITTEKLNLKTDVEEDAAASTPLVEKAVENATKTIVTDAIEILLWDEGHTRETFLKHEEELSRSSIPGVVPISKQLFSRQDPTDTQEQLLAAAAAAAVVITISHSNGEQKPEPKQQEDHQDEAVVNGNEGRTAKPPPPETDSEDQKPPAALTSTSE